MWTAWKSSIIAMTNVLFFENDWEVQTGYSEHLPSHFSFACAICKLMIETISLHDKCDQLRFGFVMETNAGTNLPQKHFICTVQQKKGECNVN